MFMIRKLHKPVRIFSLYIETIENNSLLLFDTNLIFGICASEFAVSYIEIYGGKWEEHRKKKRKNNKNKFSNLCTCSIPFKSHELRVRSTIKILYNFSLPNNSFFVFSLIVHCWFHFDLTKQKNLLSSNDIKYVCMKIIFI